MYQAGASVDSIAANLGIKPSTILQHLQKAFAAGQPIRLDGLKELSQLSTSEEQQVIRAFDELGTYRLNPVYEALGQEITYEQLHIWRLIYQLQPKPAS